MPFELSFVVIMTKIKYTIIHSTIVLCPTKVKFLLENYYYMCLVLGSGYNVSQ